MTRSWWSENLRFYLKRSRERTFNKGRIDRLSKIGQATLSLQIVALLNGKKKLLKIDGHLTFKITWSTIMQRVTDASNICVCKTCLRFFSRKKLHAGYTIRTEHWITDVAVYFCRHQLSLLQICHKPLSGDVKGISCPERVFLPWPWAWSANKCSAKVVSLFLLVVVL